MACFYFSIGGLAVGLGLTRSSSASVVSALDIHRAVSESGERKKEWEKKRERSSGDPKTLHLVLFWLHAFNNL